MRERDWLIPLAIISGIQVALWVLASSAGYAHPPRMHAYAAAAFLVVLAVGIFRLFWFIFAMAIGGEPRPTHRLVTAMRESLPRIGAIIAATACITAGSATFAALKGAIPSAIPFWLDPYLARSEALFGVQPWQVSHALFGWATPMIDVIYGTFIPVHMVALCWLLLAKPSANRGQAIVALSLTWLTLGVVAAFALSSTGPIFYDRVYGGDTFAALNVHLRDYAPLTMAGDRLLWDAYSSNSNLVGNGISAMPSMHVALTVWLALAMRGTRLAPLAWAYCGAIWFGSVHLGWHYVLDGLVGGLGAALCWFGLPSNQVISLKEKGCAAARPQCDSI